jgi:hypothetical protein
MTLFSQELNSQKLIILKTLGLQRSYFSLNSYNYRLVEQEKDQIENLFNELQRIYDNTNINNIPRIYTFNEQSQVMKKVRELSIPIYLNLLKAKDNHNPQFINTLIQIICTNTDYMKKLDIPKSSLIYTKEYQIYHQLKLVIETPTFYKTANNLVGPVKAAQKRLESAKNTTLNLLKLNGWKSMMTQQKKDEKTAFEELYTLLNESVTTYVDDKKIIETAQKCCQILFLRLDNKLKWAMVEDYLLKTGAIFNPKK